MPIHKPFLSFSQQLDTLVNDKCLVVSDREYAEKMLKQISYFALICGYKQLFKDSTTAKYKANTTFEEIVALYKFDESLRELFLKYLLQIERNMRSLLSYYFVEMYGEQQSKYLSSASYSTNPKHRQGRTELIGILSEIAVSTTKYEYIIHQRNHGNVPLWVLVNVLTFGNISKMYKFYPQSLQSKISKNFDKVNESELGCYLATLTKFRNVCAHNERLFLYKTRDAIPDTVLHSKLNIRKTGTQYIYGKRDLFSVVIAFRYILPKEDFFALKRQLGRIIEIFLHETTHITREELLGKMGFPVNWKKISSFQI